jgi:murein DD-endopeptidase MepM/ murein hydrolase activator NlpD
VPTGAALSASLTRLRLGPVVAAAFVTLALAAPAHGLVPEFDDEARYRPTIERFAVPLRGPVHSPFGYRWGRTHDGIDIAVLATDAVHAALPGVVTAVGYLPHYEGYGNVVRLRHVRGLTTLYAHLAATRVRVGERVASGELIARAGCTGSCTGPHLHFEVRVAGSLVDPLRFLRDRLRYNPRAAGG